MTSHDSAADYLPERMNLAALRRAAAVCRGCELYRDATQTVFGQGPRKARVILLGEIPGDQEDIAGKPFVGPAGRLLDEALAEAGLPRDQAYLTNAVKHFSWTPRGKRRLHKKPTARQIAACHPWLEAELQVVHPEGVVCLGATAAQSLLGSAFRVTQQRGRFLDARDAAEGAEWIMATHHPSAVLRAPRREDRERRRAELTADLRLAVERLAAMARRARAGAKARRP